MWKKFDNICRSSYEVKVFLKKFDVTWRSGKNRYLRFKYENADYTYNLDGLKPSKCFIIDK